MRLKIAMMIGFLALGLHVSVGQEPLTPLTIRADEEPEKELPKKKSKLPDEEPEKVVPKKKSKLVDEEPEKPKKADPKTKKGDPKPMDPLPKPKKEEEEPEPEMKEKPKASGPSLPVMRVAEVDGVPGSIVDTPPPEEPPFLNLFSLSADYLNWRIRRVPISVPLVSVRGNGQTLGPTDLNAGAFSGLRLVGRGWFNDDRLLGIEASGSIFEQRVGYTEKISDNDGSPLLERPFLSARDGSPLLVPISIPGQLSGRFEVSSATRFSGADSNLMVRLSESPSGSFRLDGLVGYRYQDFRENLTLRQITNSTAPMVGNLLLDFGNLGVIGAGGGFSISDQFRTLNQFHGAQIGLRANYTYQATFLSLGVKTAYGSNRQSVTAYGETVVHPNYAATTIDENLVPTTTIVAGGRSGLQTPNGLFVGNSNRGVSARSLGSFLGEVDLQVGLRLSDRLSFRVGYTGLYWTGVARPGQQLDSVIDPTQLRISQQFNPAGTSLGRPAIPFNSSNFFAHGWSFGAELAF